MSVLNRWFIKAASSYFMKNVDKKRGYLCDFDRVCHEVRPGDVLLLEGNNRVSRMIKYITQSPWTHASLYIGRLHDIEDPKLRAEIRKHYRGDITEQLIFESILGHTSYITSLNVYKQDHIRICRPSGISHGDVQKVLAYAIHRLGSEYNVRHFFDLGRFMLGSKLIPRRWFSSLFTNRPSKTANDICSALIAEAFISVKFPVLPLVQPKEGTPEKLEFFHRNSRLFAPCDFDYSPYFNIIKYPIIPLADAPYRHFPWNEAFVSHDEVGLHPSHTADTNEDDQPEVKISTTD